MDLDPTHLRSLQAIVRYGGYHRAAEALHLTQPAVSRHIHRLEEQLGEPLFIREGRGMRLTAFGERAVSELGEALAAHDRAVARLLDGRERPFVLGTVEHVVDPLLPGLLSVLREQLGERDLQVRVDRSFSLVEAVRREQVDAAITLGPVDASGAVELGPLELRWWRATSRPDLETLPEPVPIVAYDQPCALRELALGRLGALGARVTVAAESPHMTGVHAAARSGLGYALLAGSADGLTRVRRGPLSEPIEAPLWLLLRDEHRALAPALRAATWRGMRAAALPSAA